MKKLIQEETFNSRNLSKSSAKSQRRPYSYITVERLSDTSIKRKYPYSGGHLNLSKSCPYCGCGIGLVIIRFKDDKGFCKCGRCDAALFSLNEGNMHCTHHIGAILDKYIPCVEVEK